MREKFSLSRAFLIWITASLFYLYEMILRVAPSVMTNEIMVFYGATSTIFGVLISFYYYAYTILQIPCGIILDKIGPKYLISCSASLCSIGAFLFAGFSDIHVAEVGRFLIGAGSACAFISCLQMATSLFPSRYFPIIAGITNTMGTLGGLFGGFPVAKLANATSWTAASLYLASIGIIFFILSLCIIPRKLQKESKNTESLMISIKKTIKNKQILLSGIVAGFMYLPISAFSELWAVPFFMERYGINNETASVASSILFVGVAIGSVVLAIASKIIGGYVKTIKYSSICASTLFVLIILCNINIYISYSFVFLIGIFTGAQVLNFTCAKNNASQEIFGAALAVTNGIVMFIGAIFQPILGIFLDYFWNGKYSESGIRLYDILCYQKSMLSIPICLLIAFLLSCLIRETMHIEKA